MSCANYSLVVFNFPAVSLEDCEGGPERARRINGELVSKFLQNVQAIRGQHVAHPTS